MNQKTGFSRYFYWNYSFQLFIAVSILLCLIGMLQATFTFDFFSDEVHLFEDSLWAVEYSIPDYSQNIEDIYSYYFTEHYPERGGHPNGIALILGTVIWILNLFKEVNLENIRFFVLSIRLFLIATVLLSLLFLYLFFKEVDEINGERIGKIAVIISAIFPPFVAYSSIRAMDTMSLLFMMISLWSFIRLLKSSRPSLLSWALPGITAGIFLTLKISGPLIILLVIVYGIIFPERRKWKESAKKMMITIILSGLVLVATNNPYLYLNVLLFPPSTEFHSLTSSDDIRRFGFVGFQLAKFWEYLHPDYYHYLGYHRHGGPDLPLLGLINKYLTSSFFLLYIISFVLLVIIKKWKELILLNVPFFVLFLSLPNLQVYRLLPVFPLWLATIALACIIIWDRYPKSLHRLIISCIISLLILIVPARSFLDVSVVNKEIYLDLGDIASRNRHLHLERGILYDRDLSKVRAYKLGIPFCLKPATEGIMEEKLIFREPGEYFIDILLASSYSDNIPGPEIRVILGYKKYIIMPKNNEARWFRTGPFSINPYDREHVLSIDFKGIKYERYEIGKGKGCVVGIYDIRVIKHDRAMMEEKLPTPWWFVRNIPTTQLQF